MSVNNNTSITLTQLPQASYKEVEGKGIFEINGQKKVIREVKIGAERFFSEKGTWSESQVHAIKSLLNKMLLDEGVSQKITDSSPETTYHFTIKKDFSAGDFKVQNKATEVFAREVKESELPKTTPSFQQIDSLFRHVFTSTLPEATPNSDENYEELTSFIDDQMKKAYDPIQNPEELNGHHITTEISSKLPTTRLKRSYSDAGFYKSLEPLKDSEIKVLQPQPTVTNAIKDEPKLEVIEDEAPVPKEYHITKLENFEPQSEPIIRTFNQVKSSLSVRTNFLDDPEEVAVLNRIHFTALNFTTLNSSHQSNGPHPIYSNMPQINTILKIKQEQLESQKAAETVNDSLSTLTPQTTPDKALEVSKQVLSEVQANKTPNKIYLGDQYFNSEAMVFGKEDATVFSKLESNSATPDEVKQLLSKEMSSAIWWNLVRPGTTSEHRAKQALKNTEDILQLIAKKPGFEEINQTFSELHDAYFANKGKRLLDEIQNFPFETASDNDTLKMEIKMRGLYRKQGSEDLKTLNKAGLENRLYEDLAMIVWWKQISPSYNIFGEAYKEAQTILQNESMAPLRDNLKIISILSAK